MIKKILFLGLTFTLALSGLFGLVNIDDNVNVSISDPGNKDDDDDIDETDEGVMFLSLSMIN